MAIPTDTSPTPTATGSTMVTSSPTLMVTATEEALVVMVVEEAMEGTAGALAVTEEALEATEEDYILVSL